MTYFLTGNPQYHRRGVVSRTCSGWEGVGPTRYGRQEFCRVVGELWPTAHVLGVRRCWECVLREADAVECVVSGTSVFAQGYRVKPHGQLVPVSSEHYCSCTPGLSTWWSTTTLQGARSSGRSHLQASFPLRCFQRLSLPYIATRQCHWRDNRYTRDTSTPVLSY